MPRSAVEFGDDENRPQSYATPRALGASTRGTYEQRTAWYTKDMSGGAPLPYSKQSAGSVYRFDDGSGSAPTIKTPDKQ